MVRVTRSALRPGSVAEIVAAFAEASRAVARLDRARLGLLIDLRLSPGNNDPEFETAMAPQRAQLTSGFAAVAVLVQTPTGALQISRINRQDGTEPGVFTDEPQAIAWLAKRT